MNDDLIFEAIERFGGDGYMVFFGTLEILADNFNIHDPGVWHGKIKKMTKNFQISAKKLTKILHFFDKKAKNCAGKMESFYVSIEEDNVTISCPKFSKLCDEYTRVKMSQISGPSQEKLRRKSYTDTDTDTEADKDSVVYPPAGGFFSEKMSAYMEQIVEKCKKIESLSIRDRKNLNIWAFVQGAVSGNGHPKAIDTALGMCIARWKTVTSPWPYMTSIFQMKNGNLWEEEHIQKAREFKKEWISNKQIQELIAKIGGGGQ